jgi:ketosteroid isomerase-like protein
MRQFEEARELWDSDTLDPISDFIDAGTRVVVRLIRRCVGRGPDAQMEFTIVYPVRDGRIFGIEIFWDHAQALEAVGLET